MSLDQQPTAPPPAPSDVAAPEPAGAGPAAMGAGQWARLALVAGLLVLLTATTGVWGLVMVLGIVVMIFLHELGHFVMAKRAGMKVTEFFLGFGPRIWSVHRGETEYGLKLIPAGAYVKIIGMHNIEEVDPADEAKTYRQQPFWQRFGVAVAGSTVHFALALVLIFILLAGIGVPGGSLSGGAEDKWRVDGIEAGTPAYAAGLRDGDDLVAVDGRATPTFDDLREAVADRPGDQVTLTVARGDRTFDTTATLVARDDDRTAGFLGVGGTLPEERLGVVEAVPATFQQFGTVLGQSVQGLGRVFSPSGIADFGGQVVNARDDVPDASEGESASGGSSSSSSAATEDGSENRLLSLLGVFRIGVDFGDAGGAASVMLLFAFMNIFIGMFNLLPILPFDGGHVAIAIYEKAQERRKRLQQRYFADVGRLLPMTYAVVFVLGLIFVSTLYVDAVNPLSVN